MGQFEEQLLNLSQNRTLDYNQCQCLPKAELKTKTNPNGHHPVAVWVRFGFQLGSLEKKCSGLRGKPCNGYVTIVYYQNIKK